MTLHIAAQIIADCGENCKITVCALHPITHAHRVAHSFLWTGEDDVLPTMRTGISGFVDDMAGDAGHLSVQDSIIVASLDSISGKHCLQIKNLFVHAGIFAGIAHLQQLTACVTHMMLLLPPCLYYLCMQRTSVFQRLSSVCCSPPPKTHPHPHRRWSASSQ